MDKKYDGLSKLLVKLEGDKGNLVERLNLAQEGHETLIGRSFDIDALIKKSLADNLPGEEIKNLYDGKDSLDFELQKNLDTILGVTQKIEGVEVEVTQIKGKLEQRFRELCEVWLLKEIRNYNAVLGDFIKCVKRLRAARSILLDKEALDVFRKTIGLAGEYIHKIKVPTIDNFSGAVDYRNSSDLMRFTEDERSGVLKEILR